MIFLKWSLFLVWLLLTFIIFLTIIPAVVMAQFQALDNWLELPLKLKDF